MTDTSITVKANDGKTQKVKLAPDAGFVWVEKASLGEHAAIGSDRQVSK